MNQALVSVVVPVYKVPEDYLKQCVESIQNQVYRNLEIILVDDGSPDKCGELCDNYASNDNRILVIHKDNEGLSAARNSGYKKSSGKYLMFVDGDDWIDSHMIDEMVNIAEKKESQIVMCGMSKDYGGKSEPYKYYIESNKLYKGEECKWLQEQLLHFNGNIAMAYCKLILKSLLDDYAIMHDPVLKQGAEGIEFNLRLFERVESAYFINKSFYHYIYNSDSISASHSEANHEFVIKCFEKIKAFMEISDNKDMLKPWFNNRLLYVIITTAISGYFSPTNTEPYVDKKRKYSKYLEKTIVKEALKTKKTDGIGKQRKVALFFIKHRMYLMLDMMGKMRKWQKEHK